MSAHAQPFLLATSLILRIKSQMFQIWRNLPDAESQEETGTFTAWIILNKAAESMLATRCTQLDVPQRERMIGALQLHHKLAHRPEIVGEVVPSIAHCPCEAARLQRELALVMAAEIGQVA